VSGRSITFYPKYTSLVGQVTTPDYFTNPQRSADFYKVNCQVTLEAISAGSVNISIQTSSDGMWWTAKSSLTPAVVGTQQLEATGLLQDATGGTVEMGIHQDFYYEHSSRQCTPRGAKEAPACICAGSSQSLSWLARYRYTLKVTGYGSAAAIALAEGRAFARVKHVVHNWTRGSPGFEKEVAGWEVVEYFQIKPSGESETDCITYSHPFDQFSACWLRSESETEAVLQLSDSADIDPVTMESFEIVQPKPSEGQRPPNKKVDLTKEDKGIPLTPGDIVFTSSDAGGTHSATKSLEPNPHHCANWRRYLTAQENPKKTNSTKGKYFTPDGEPPGVYEVSSSNGEEAASEYASVDSAGGAPVGGPSGHGLTAVGEGESIGLRPHGEVIEGGVLGSNDPGSGDVNETRH
jgi:hypothetical protein